MQADIKKDGFTTLHISSSNGHVNLLVVINIATGYRELAWTISKHKDRDRSLDTLIQHFTLAIQKYLTEIAAGERICCQWNI